MKEKPILFSGPMVRALLEGRKTQTRRVVKLPEAVIFLKPEFMPCRRWEFPSDTSSYRHQMDCTYGKPGDRLWVKETHALTLEPEPWNPHAKFPFAYRADWRGEDDETRAFRWKPSIFCARKASRINLEITGIMVERLNDISEPDAIAEGLKRCIPNDPHPLPYWEVPGTSGLGNTNPVYCYEQLWESINGPGSWALNPWVWVVEFKVVKGGGE